MIPPGIGKPNSETPVHPDNDYLETMKQRMKGVPINTSNSTGIKKNWMPSQQTFDGSMTQDILSKTIDAVVSPKASNAHLGESPNEKLASSAKVSNNS
jgi:hypothetical protein